MRTMLALGHQNSTRTTIVIAGHRREVPPPRPVKPKEPVAPRPARRDAPVATASSAVH